MTSIWQDILIGGWVLALICGADKRLAAIVAGNFTITALWPGLVGVVGIADLATIAALAMLGRRGQALAYLYVIASTVRAGGAAMGFPDATTYAILDPIGWAILAVLGNVDTGIRYWLRRWRASVGRFGRYRSGGGDIVAAQGRDPGVSVALVSGEGE